MNTTAPGAVADILTTAPLPYYEDEAVTLYNARCEDVLPGLELSGPVHLLTDPPYFGVKPDEWDNQWSKADEFLGWMGEWLDLAKPHLGGDASVWVFASPEMTSAVERVVAERFRVLNTVRWLKQATQTHRMSLPTLRSFMPQWEGIVFAEQYAPGSVAGTPLGEYMRAEWRRAGWSDGAVGPALGYDSALGRMWGKGTRLPSADAYERMRELLGDGYLRAEYEQLRRPFNVTNRKLSSDVWALPSVPPDPNRHPCEKPEALIAHMIETTTRPGDTVLDPFAGSGAILDTARQLGRKAVGIEMDRHWCDHAVRRVAQMTLPMMD